MFRDFDEILRNAGLRVTSARLSALSFFAQQHRPVSLQRVAAHLRDTNLATVYRMIDSFLHAGIVRGCDVGHGHMDYELADLPHHHHVICMSCGFIEEVDDCLGDELLHERTAVASKRFASVTAHQSTFYGLCKKCA